MLVPANEKSSSRTGIPPDWPIVRGSVSVWCIRGLAAGMVRRGVLREGVEGLLSDGELVA